MDINIPEHEEKGIEHIICKADFMADKACKALAEHRGEGVSREEFLQFRLSIFNKLLETAQFSINPPIAESEPLDYTRW